MVYGLETVCASSFNKVTISKKGGERGRGLKEATKRQWQVSKGVEDGGWSQSTCAARNSKMLVGISISIM